MRTDIQHRKRKLVNSMMSSLTMLCAVIAISTLLIILGYIATKGITSINLEFLTDTPKPVGEGGGIGNAILGSLMMTVLACAIGLPIGIMAGVYLSEMGDGWYGKTVRFLADTLTGIPSIIVGIFVYTLIVIPMGRQSGLAGGLALTIIILGTLSTPVSCILNGLAFHFT